MRSTAPRFRTCRRGVSALEFALVAPIFLMLLFGIVSYGFHLALVHGVQQIAAEAARASVAGLTDAERATIARDNVAAGAPSYPLLNPARLSIVSAATNQGTMTFLLTLRYDASDMIIYRLPFVAMPSSTIIRTSAVQRGGY